MKRIIFLFFLLIPLSLWAQLPNISFFTPELAGTLKFGIAKGEQSVWLTNLKDVKVENKNEETIYNLQKALVGEGSLRFSIKKLKDTEGVVLKVDVQNIPQNLKLMWVFGGCSNEKADPTIIQGINPEACQDNVFSVEGNAFTVYYGTSRSLRVFQGIVPPVSEIRLSDAHQQATPMAMFNSGKKTDAPALCGQTPLEAGTSLYFCFYRQNATADYNYFMLPELFETGKASVQIKTEWMKSTPD